MTKKARSLPRKNIKTPSVQVPRQQSTQQFMVQCTTQEAVRKLISFATENPGITCYKQMLSGVPTELEDSLSGEGATATARELDTANKTVVRLDKKSCQSSDRLVDYDASAIEEQLMQDNLRHLRTPKKVAHNNAHMSVDDFEAGKRRLTSRNRSNDFIPEGIDAVAASPVILCEGEVVRRKSSAESLLKRTPRPATRAARRESQTLTPLACRPTQTPKIPLPTYMSADGDASTRDSSSRRVTCTRKSTRRSQREAKKAKHDSQSLSSPETPTTVTQDGDHMSLEVADEQMLAGRHISNAKFRKGFVSPDTGEIVYVVRDILGYRRRGKSIEEYNVAWEGYPDSAATWEPAANIPASEWKEERDDARRKYELEQKLRHGVKRRRDPEVLSEFAEDIIPLD